MDNRGRKLIDHCLHQWQPILGCCKTAGVSRGNIVHLITSINFQSPDCILIRRNASGKWEAIKATYDPCKKTQLSVIGSAKHRKSLGVTVAPECFPIRRVA